MLTPEQIKTLIDCDEASERKKMARTGLRYYRAQHDILGKRIFFFDADGKLQEDKTKVNTRISHPFFTELVDQEVQYLLSGDGAIIKSDDPELQKELDIRFNENDDFLSELYDIATDAAIKGDGYAYRYKGADGRSVFECADSLGITEVRKSETDDGCQYIIYRYVERKDPYGRSIKRIQVWDDVQTWFYCQVDDGEIEIDDSVEINPRPHTLYKKGDDARRYIDGGFGAIPFYRMDYNRERVSGLAPIKGLIDDYDVMNCGLSNNIEDTNEALYVVRGFEGDNLDELMQNIKAKKHIGVSDEGGVDVETVDIPVEARKTKMEIDERNIFRFGCGLNISDLKDTNATTSVAIKSAYTLLDMKANKLEMKMRKFLRAILRDVLQEINDTMGTDYQQTDVYFDFDREIVTNELENAQIDQAEAQTRQVEINTLLGLANKLDNETLMQLICEQLDIDYNDIRDKLPEPEEVNDPYQASSALDTLTEEPDDGGGLIE